MIYIAAVAWIVAIVIIVAFVSVAGRTPDRGDR